MYIALSQVILALVVVIIFMWSRGRLVRRRYKSMEDRCNEAKLALDRARLIVEKYVEYEDWRQQLRSKLDTLKTASDHPSTQMHRTILAFELGDETQDFSTLRTALDQLVTVGGDPAKEQALSMEIAQLKSEIEELQSQEGQTDNESEGSTEQDLKALVHQFTSESRDMLSCIETLESENQQLKAMLEQNEDAA